MFLIDYTIPRIRYRRVEMHPDCSTYPSRLGIISDGIQLIPQTPRQIWRQNCQGKERKEGRVVAQLPLRCRLPCRLPCRKQTLKLPWSGCDDVRRSHSKMDHQASYRKRRQTSRLVYAFTRTMSAGTQPAQPQEDQWIKDQAENAGDGRRRCRICGEMT